MFLRVLTCKYCRSAKNCYFSLSSWCPISIYVWDFNIICLFLWFWSLQLLQEVWHKKFWCSMLKLLGRLFTKIIIIGRKKFIQVRHYLNFDAHFHRVGSLAFMQECYRKQPYELHCWTSNINVCFILKKKVFFYYINLMKT